MEDDDYFEWWYFHFIASQGYTISLVLHLTDLFVPITKPYVAMSIASPERQSLHLRRYLSGDPRTLETDPLNLDFEKCFVRDTEEKIIFDIDFEGARFSAGIRKPSVQAVISRVPLYSCAGASHNWVVPIPCAQFEGKLELHHNVLTIDGIAYHDHNWGNGRIERNVREWLWGHLVFDKGYLVFYDIVLLPECLIRVSVLEIEGSQFTSSDFKLVKEVETKAFTEAPFPETLEVGVSRPLPFTVQIVPDCLFHSKRERCKDGLLLTYGRATATGVLTIWGTKRQARGVIERLLIE